MDTGLCGLLQYVGDVGFEGCESFYVYNLGLVLGLYDLWHMGGKVVRFWKWYVMHILQGVVKVEIIYLVQAGVDDCIIVI